ncbi:hypothetical protein HDE_01332 [Halotydeus destructor]|nr:hypothetical protein HDE_01332 [Halotydeus destructor]
MIKLSSVVILGLTLIAVTYGQETFDDGMWRPQAGTPVQTFVNIYSHPKTQFSCEDRVSSEYYADPETNCAIYYICLPTQSGKLSPTSFACPNGTIFNQATRVCQPHDQVHCNLATRYYDSIHGHIDSKGKDPKQFQPNTVFAPSTPWNSQEHARVAAARQPAASQRRPVQSGRPVQSTQANQANARRVAGPTSTPTPTTAANAGPAEYEYVDYEQPSGQAQPPAGRSRRSARRKGPLPSFPLDFLSRPAHQVAILSNFTCADKIAGIAYADMVNNCTMFHLCLPTDTKGKLADNQMFCADGQGYNQDKGSCQATGSFDCAKSEKFFLYNKMATQDGRRKWQVEKKNYKKY